MKAILVIVIMGTVLLSGCVSTVKKNWSATGGSRADAIVKLSYEYGENEKPQVNEEEAIALAKTRCATWGYSGAEAFGGYTRQCSTPGGPFSFSACSRWIVTKEYQCTGLGNKDPASPPEPAEAQQEQRRWW